MTDIDFYTALQICTAADPKHRKCGKCPLLHSEQVCEFVLREEIRNRLILARQDRSKGYTQLSYLA